MLLCQRIFLDVCFICFRPIFTHTSNGSLSTHLPLPCGRLLCLLCGTCWPHGGSQGLPLSCGCRPTLGELCLPGLGRGAFSVILSLWAVGDLWWFRPMKVSPSTSHSRFPSVPSEWQGLCPFPQTMTPLLYAEGSGRGSQLHLQWQADPCPTCPVTGAVSDFLHHPQPSPWEPGEGIWKRALECLQTPLVSTPLWILYSCVNPHSAWGNLLKLIAEFFFPILPLESPIFFLCSDPGESNLTSLLP